MTSKITTIILIAAVLGVQSQLSAIPNLPGAGQGGNFLSAFFPFLGQTNPLETFAAAPQTIANGIFSTMQNVMRPPQGQGSAFTPFLSAFNPATFLQGGQQQAQTAAPVRSTTAAPAGAPPAPPVFVMPATIMSGITTLPGSNLIAGGKRLGTSEQNAAQSTATETKPQEETIVA